MHPATQRPEPDLLLLLRRSLERWDPTPGAFERAFDANLRDHRPAALTAPETLGVCRALARQLVLPIGRGESDGATESFWHDLGTFHAAHGFPDAGYAAVGRALMRTARDLDGEWTGRLSSAWAGLLLWMQGPLLSGAARGRAVAAARPAPPVEPRDAPSAAGVAGASVVAVAAEAEVEDGPEPVAAAQGDPQPGAADIVGMVLGGSPPRRPRKRRAR